MPDSVRAAMLHCFSLG